MKILLPFIICLSLAASTLAFSPTGVTQTGRSLRSQSAIIPKAFLSRHDDKKKVIMPWALQSTSAAATAVAVQPEIPSWRQRLVKVGMMMYITGLCVALPATLLPQRLLYKLGLISREQKEHFAVRTACFCSRWVLRTIPFCKLDVVPSGEPRSQEPAPSVWVCNHTSMLDIFMLLAADKRLRGPKKRPIKIIYWKQLEDNPVTRLLFRQSGFIAVDMEANGSGTANSYDRATFKKLLKDCKQAFADGFDIGILPEGQLNPAPEKGLLPIFTGAFTLAKMSRRPIQMMALHGAHKLWHADESIGMTVQDNKVKVRCYPFARVYADPEDFKETFRTVVGTFGATGEDLPTPDLKGWLSGNKWEEKQKQRQQQEQQQ